MSISHVVSDGRITSCARDQPGQHSIYIPPGEPERELYRLTTFQKFPEYSPANPCQLAAGGFYYTGFRDRVKCFSCAQAVESWCIGDDPLSSRWHKLDCQFIRGSDDCNVPISRTFSNLHHQNTSARVSSSFSRSSGPVLLVPSRTLTASASENLGDVSDPAVSTSKNVAPSSEQTATNTRLGTATTSTVFEQLAQIFPCSNSVNPHMQSEAARLQTFRDRSDEWPAHRIAATAERMAQAGLYYLGERDRVKCWYCNGGLQNWDRFDDPWFEHAKWFPTCEYLLQKKGPEFVANVVDMFPNLDRPAPVNPASSLATTSPRVSSGIRFPTSLNQFPQILDPRETQRDLERKVDEEMETSSFVADARLMGFSAEEIRCAMLRQFEEHSTTFPSFASLVEKVLAAQKTNHSSSVFNTETSNEHVPSTSASANPSSSSLQNEYWKQELRSLKHMSLCKKCFRSKASVVLLPCGHLALCSDCARESSLCPLCNGNIQETIHSYLV